MNLTYTVYCHGSASEAVSPTFWLGDDHHDDGRRLCLTADLTLAKES